MKKFLLISHISFLASPFSFSQNLVPNPSFELYNACPDTAPGINSADYWYNPAGFTPDYLNSCDTNIAYPYYGVPLNQYGNQSARTGVAYAGIILSYLLIGPADSVREYIEVKLLDSLKAGKSYDVSFYVSLGDRSPYAANDIGAYFSDTLISLPSYPYPLPFIPQIQNNPLSNPLIDTILWMEVQDTFIAQGGETYIIIGNFKNDANTDTTNLDIGNPNTDPWAYYYIDDVSVICLDCTVGINDISINDKIKIYPNPSHDYLQIKTDNISVDKIEVINILGEIIFSQSNPPPNNTHSIDLSNQGKGIYLLKLYATNGTLYTKPIIIN